MGIEPTTSGLDLLLPIFSLPRVVPCFPLLGLTPSGLFMGLISTLIYTSELILCSTKLHNVSLHLDRVRARFFKFPETFLVRKALFTFSVSKNGEVHAHETSCMKATSVHIKNMWIKLLSNRKVQDLLRGGTPYRGLYGEAPPGRGTFFRHQVYKRVGILQVEVYKRVGKSVVSQRELNE